MMPKDALRVDQTTFDSIYIIEDRNQWQDCADQVNKANDLILCVDFGLKHYLIQQGYFAQFIDHLVHESVLECQNYKMHNFLNEWFKDVDGNDLFLYKGYNIGDSLLLHLINDTTFFCHYFLNIIGIKALNYKQIFVAVTDTTIIDCLNKASLPFKLLNTVKPETHPVYIFPIIKWVKENTQKVSLRFRVKKSIASLFDSINKLADTFFKKKHYVFIQSYHPTKPVIESLNSIPDLQLILQNYSGIKNVFKERRINHSNEGNNNNIVSSLYNNYRKNRHITWCFEEYAISDYLYELIDKVVERELDKAINMADDIDRYFKKVQLSMMVPITNYWTSNRLLMNYCRNQNIPVFMIINGLLNVSYIHDGKDSDMVNCYSETLKQDYFSNKDTALPLGDPRMDRYTKVEKRLINSVEPIIVIGAAGYDSLDLNSYLAFEFDFLYDILEAIKNLRDIGYKNSVILKVRANGYVYLYENLVNEYFKELNVDIVQDLSFFEVVTKADFYISICSQTIFEAASLGIPTLYYKKDTQDIYRPFDKKSELVTASTINELVTKLTAFYNADTMYDAFLNKDVLEKYIGPLDGNNTQRNVDLIKSVLAL